jgi:hypothetical protein
VLERAVCLGAVVNERLFKTLRALPFLHGGSVERAQRVLDALYRADRVFRVEVRLVGSRAAAY